MDYQLASGARLVVSQAPFVDAFALHKALLASVKGTPLTDEQGRPLELGNLAKMDINALKDLCIAAATSPEVQRTLDLCAQRATYNARKVDTDLFDDPKDGGKAREDYYEIAWKIIEVNALPFFKTTFSRLKGALPGAPTASPASPSAPATTSA